MISCSGASAPYRRPMLQVLVNVLVPVFGVVGVGFALARLVGVGPPALASISYWVLGPVFIFDVLAKADLEAGVVGKIVVATAAAMAMVAVITALVTRLIGVSFSALAATVLTSIYGNVGNFGLAISVFALGDEALPIAGIVLVTVNTLGILTGVGLATIRHGSAIRAATTAVLSPLALAVIPALAVNFSNTTLPLWLDRPLSLLAAALIPVMLLTLGIQIAGMPRVMPPKLVAVPIALKLIAAPLAALVAIASIGLEGLPSHVVILQAAMPAAVFTSLIALEHHLEADYVTSVVLIGTLISAVTLPVVITLL